MRIYLDLDGVMADFDTHFVEKFGVDPQTLADDVMWKMINGYHDFYANLPLMKDAKELFDFLMWGPWMAPWEPEGVSILTACPRSNYKNAAIQKRAWVREHLSKDITVIPMMGGVNKAMFMHEPGDILIDDMEKNCKAWEENGGVAIVHKSVAETLREICKITGL